MVRIINRWVRRDATASTDRCLTLREDAERECLSAVTIARSTVHIFEKQWPGGADRREKVLWRMTEKVPASARSTTLSGGSYTRLLDLYTTLMRVIGAGHGLTMRQ